MDAQPSLARAAGLTVLVQGVARYAVEVPDPHDLTDEVVLANDFRARTHGLDATVHGGDGSKRSMRQVAARALDDARKVLAPEGLDRPLEAVRAMLELRPEQLRQRHLCEEQGMPAVLADLAARTADIDGRP
jgi:gamma-glutamyl:cysteine ligase YbdK (ATP-grasp superfamily)